ncbi:hypothetical protein B2D07_18950 [Desulfococcus multivorans]|uniref:Uncharacterized protein n=1 Tax=Desulfococcus multivorans DSM 2059 TaxID=1121405 RepID=S7TST9_DESML|nr:hypothetical protein B2D07_18950 [Desulfococcus multivorans]EPR39740.1 hypothetical protein dsmv_2588 [Desulfococcus multivorans DSM 2059]SKA05089.1 hypothetical protein SAMN02745446_02575 [Desulfococcus multivorans DSM 2059]
MSDLKRTPTEERGKPQSMKLKTKEEILKRCLACKGGAVTKIMRCKTDLCVNYDFREAALGG